MKYKCKVGYESGVWLTEGKIYEDKNGSMTFDDGWTDTTWRIGLLLGYNEFSYYLEEIKDEKVEEMEKIMKREFKVGDLVKGNNPTRYGITNTRMTKGEVVRVIAKDEIKVKVVEHPYRFEIGRTYYVDPQYFDLLELEPKSQSLHITVKNNQTIGVLKEDGVIVKRAVANLHPHDTFDFKVGSKIVYDRLFGVDKVEVVEEPKSKEYEFKVGDKVRVLDGRDIKEYRGGWVKEMGEKIGKIYTIEKLYERGGVKLVGTCLTWDIRGLELVTTNTPSIQSFTDDELLSELKRRMEK